MNKFSYELFEAYEPHTSLTVEVMDANEVHASNARPAYSDKRQVYKNEQSLRQHRKA